MGLAGTGGDAGWDLRPGAAGAFDVADEGEAAKAGLEETAAATGGAAGLDC